MENNGQEARGINLVVIRVSLVEVSENSELSVWILILQSSGMWHRVLHARFILFFPCACHSTLTPSSTTAP